MGTRTVLHAGTGRVQVKLAAGRCRLYLVWVRGGRRLINSLCG